MTYSIRQQIFKYIKTKQNGVLYLLQDAFIILTSTKMNRLDFTIFYKPKGYQEKY